MSCMLANCRLKRALAAVEVVCGTHSKVFLPSDSNSSNAQSFRCNLVCTQSLPPAPPSPKSTCWHTVKCWKKGVVAVESGCGRYQRLSCLRKL
ncbi:hypothetical protein J1614_011742 [Plenodomus biglobosus]|nr:hypothetical protein J1614_011742 [Plenodomus biglobosus]